MAKIELECKFRLCPHNEFDKCMIPGGVTIIQSGRCIHASIVLDARKSSEQEDSPANSGGVAGGQGTANSAMPKLLKELRCLIEEATFDQSEYEYRCFEILEQLSA